MSSDATEPQAPGELPTEQEASTPTSASEPLQQPAEAARATKSPAERMRIGSQRTGHAEMPQPKAVANVPSTKPESERQPKQSGGTKKYPPPNTRGQLSPELEVEFAEALAGMSIDEALASGVNSGEVELEPETRRLGRVLAVHRDLVFVDLGGRKQGAVPLRLFESPPEIGAHLDVTISRFNAPEGFYELVLPGAAVEVADWSEIHEGMVVEARITGHNKGGLECEVNRIRGFIPAGQASLYRVEELATLVGEKFACVVTEANPAKGNLILSRRAVLEREKAEARDNLMAELEVGQTREGTVRSLQNFGAFVDLGGVDGLIHISQLSWDRIMHAEEVLEVGQKVKVKIQKIDPSTGKIGLGFRDLSENPWERAATKYPSKSRVKATVSRIMDFGVFLKLEPGVEGLVHVSEISHKRVWRISDILKEGQEVEAQIMTVDPEQQRIALSMKALEARPTPTKSEPEPEPEEEAVEVAPVRKSNKPLKGGVTRTSGGEKFGLNW